MNDSKESSTARNGVTDTLAGFISINQLILLSFTLALGSSIAYYNHSWFTFAGATFGLALHVLLYFSWSYTEMFVRSCSLRLPRFGLDAALLWARQVASRSLRFLCMVSLGESGGTELVQTLQQVVRRQKSFWGYFVDEAPSARRRLLFSTALKSPTYYARWAVVGLLMGSLIEAMLSRSEAKLSPASTLTTSIDFYLGLLVALSALRETLQDLGRHALSEAQDVVPASIANAIASCRTVPDASSGDARHVLARLREAVRVKQYQIGQFFHNSWGLLDNVYGLLIVGLVLVLISPLGALLALVGVCSMIPSMLFELLNLKREEQKNAVNHARRRALQELSEDPDWQVVLEKVAPEEAVSGLLSDISLEIRSNRAFDKTKQMIQRNLARLVFFTLFALSTLFPVLETFNGDLRPRVTLLYIFSMLGLWYAVSAIAERASSLVAKVDELSEVDEATQVVADNRPEDTPTASSASVSSEIVVNHMSFGYPFKELILRFDQRLVIPPTITLATTIRVVGRAQSGKTTLLKLLCGMKQASAGSIEIGGMDPGLPSLAQRLIYIPERVPRFPRIKIHELFTAYLREELEGKEVREYLRIFGLLDELYDESRPEWTGENLLINFKDQYLDDVQQRLLFYALQYAALERRNGDSSFRPLLIAVDGISRLPSLALRERCFQAFKSIADSYCASLAVSTVDFRELGEEDFVLSILEKEDYPPKSTLVDRNGNLVTGGKHKNRWHHSDKFKQKRYRDYLRALADSR